MTEEKWDGVQIFEIPDGWPQAAERKTATELYAKIAQADILDYEMFMVIRDTWQARQNLKRDVKELCARFGEKSDARDKDLSRMMAKP